MSGKQHVASGVALGNLTYTGYLYLQDHVTIEVGQRVLQKIAGFFDYGTDLWLPVCILLYFLGLLLPDVDSENSMLGRYIRIGSAHRKWLHTIYPVFVILFFSIKSSLLPYLALGYFFHLWMDSFSKCGTCWFDPVHGYRNYPGGAKVKKRWHLVLYTNEISGWVFCTVLIMLSFFFAWENRYLFFL